MLPFNPLSMDEHRARYKRAVEKVYDVEAVKLGTSIRPGENADQVFDTPYGVRLMVSRDRYEDGRIFIHVSASVYAGTKAWHDVKNGKVHPHYFCDLAMAAFQEISGATGVIQFLGWSEEKGIPHWRMEDR